MNAAQLERVVATLANDENSSDDDLLVFFVDSVGVSREEAMEQIAKRTYYLNNIVDVAGNLIAHPGRD
jgi:hypothetical protein